MGPGLRSSLVGLAWCAAGVLAGCSAIVGSPPTEIWCEPGIDPELQICPEGQVCVEGVCSSCRPRPEQCNGLDDDCDGTVDDGLDVDLDMDGAPACRDGELVDCRDDDPAISPGVADVCNGVDDDCNLATTETCSGPTEACGTPRDGGRIRCLQLGDCRDVDCLLPDGSVDPDRMCDESTGLCTSRTANCQLAGQECTPPEICSETTLRCVLPDNGPGTPCTEDSQCASGVCFPEGAFPGGGRVCSQACCDDGDCGGQNYCAAMRNGVRGCLPMIMRAPLCSTVSGCGSGQQCAMSAGVFQCRAASGGNERGRICARNSECASNVCKDFECRDPCGSRADCDFPDVVDVACLPVFAPGSSSDVITVCSSLYGGDLPDATQGAGCGDDSGCRDSYCASDTLGSYCSDTCCSSATCGPEFRCEPVYHAGSFEMRCMRR